MSAGASVAQRVEADRSEITTTLPISLLSGCHGARWGSWPALSRGGLLRKLVVFLSVDRRRQALPNSTKGDGMIILTGRPLTKKNHGQVLMRGSKRYHVQSNAYHAYEMECLFALRDCREYYETEVNLQAHYWLPNRSGYPDLVGLLQATCDILQTGGVIENDRQVSSFDGSRIMGIDKANPRVEITITESRERTNQ